MGKIWQMNPTPYWNEYRIHVDLWLSPLHVHDISVNVPRMQVDLTAANFDKIDI